MENDNTRSFNILSQPAVGLAFNFQMVFMEVCISENNAVDPISKTTRPMIKDTVPLPSKDAFFTTSWICAAASLPTNPANCKYNCPSMAALPKNMLDKEMMTMINGPKENMIVYASDPASLATLSSMKELPAFLKTFHIIFTLSFPDAIFNVIPFFKCG